MDTAVEYADQFGWQVVPLSPNPDVAEEDSDDPVIRLLGRSPLVDVPREATSRPEELRELTGFPVASLAVLTGEASNLAAVEIGPAAERGLEERELEQFRQSLPDTRRICGPDRDYYLFSLRSVADGSLDLPRLTRSDGVILHGEGSLIRVPGPRSRGGVRAFRWDVQTDAGMAPFPKELLSFFGVKTGVDGVLSWSKQPAGANEESSSASQSSESTGSTASANGSSSASRSTEGRSGSGSLSFRSGQDLRQTSEEPDSSIRIPWLGEGTLSLLCGPTKTAGKSTFVANLAAHLAAGRRFLGRDLEAGRVVLLSDLPASQFRSLLARIGIDREARERLHVVHPEDARRPSWQTLLSKTFAFAEQQDAALVILDSLDQFVEVKGGVDPRTNVDVVHTLTTEAPPETALLAVKALSSTKTSRVSSTIGRLGLLGRAADVVAKLDSGLTQSTPTLRRLQFASRLEGVPTHVLCEMVRGRYQKVRRDSRELEMPHEDGAPAGDLAQGDGALPEVITSEEESGTGQEDGSLSPKGPRSSVVPEKLAESGSDS